VVRLSVVEGQRESVNEERIRQRVAELARFMALEAEAAGPELGAVLLRVADALVQDTVPDSQDLGLVTMHLLQVRAREAQQGGPRQRELEAIVAARVSEVRREYERREAMLRAELRSQYAQREAQLRAQLAGSVRQAHGFSEQPASEVRQPPGGFRDVVPAVPGGIEIQIEQRFHERGRAMSRSDGRRVIVFGGGW